MMYTIFIVLWVLVALNFLLLRISCNVTLKEEKISKPVGVEHYKTLATT